MTTRNNKRLTQAEMQIMNTLWSLSEATVRQVQESLKSKKKPAYNTVLTMMRILRDKGIVASRRDGKTDIYHPLVTRKQIGRNYLDEMLQVFFSGSASALVSQLLESKKVDETELDEIRKMLENGGNEDEQTG
tara:strand:- start:90 stop:488 length:399 start_codon:yes stop_codon:yes gene_type:complete